MDKNVIFVYPLNALLNELKKELEKDESFSVLEVDMLSEYGLLIESINFSITFSADIKKTAMFLEACRKYTKEKNHLNILISKQTPSGLTLSRMEKDGLNEFLGDFTKLKSLMVKINHFYKDFATKGVTDFSMGTTHTNKIDTTSEQRLERLVKDQKNPTNLLGEESLNERATNLAQFEINELKHTVKNELETPPLEGRTVDRSGIPYSIKKEKRPGSASDWTGIEAEEKNQYSSSLVESLIKNVNTDNPESVPNQSKKELPLSLATRDLPEITFFPALRIFDPIAFYMEILLSKSDSDFKKKYLKMCLLKVYRAQFYTANSEGEWEESTPGALKVFNSLEYKGPTWINEGRDEFENLFIMPIVFDDDFLGGIGLVIPGQINHEKMREMEFWCYLGRCTCS